MTTTKADRIAEATNTLIPQAEQRIRLKRELDALTQRLKDFDEALIDLFQTVGVTKVETSLGNLNLVQSNTVAWNDEVLKELLTPAQWKRITVEKVDKTRLDAELVVGRIDEEQVSVARSVKQSRPFLR